MRVPIALADTRAMVSFRAVVGGTVRGQARVSWLTHRSLTPIVACAALLAITYFGFGAWRYVAHNYRLSSDEAEIRRDITELDEQRAQLVAVNDYLKSDEYVEYVARSVLGLVRPGETLVIVSSTAPEALPTATAAAGDASVEQRPWWQDLFVQPQLAPTPAP